LPKQIVVALTANANVGERDKCLDAGMDDYLAKPFTQDQLAAILARWLTSAAFAPVSGTAMNKPIASATHAVWDKEAALRCLMGDEELLNAMLETFLDEAPGQLSVILTAISAQDLEQLGNAAHSLKGSFGYLGVAEAMAQVTKIETLARKNEQADYHQLGEDLVMETNSLMDIFRQFLAENQ
jgi:HPt (histidine-containing phosphotransfer) domain-containing protein